MFVFRFHSSRSFFAVVLRHVLLTWTAAAFEAGKRAEENEIQLPRWTIALLANEHLYFLAVFGLFAMAAVVIFPAPWLVKQPDEIRILLN